MGRRPKPPRKARKRNIERRTSRISKRNRKRQAKRRVRNGCSGKKQYTEWERAVEAAQRLLARHGLNRCSIYICEHGLHYHVSKRTSGTNHWWLVERETK